MKKIINIALALLMVAVMLPVMAMAEEPATALPTADANGVITLEKDVVLADAVEINSDVTIDLHGWSITSSNGNSGKVIIAMANVTIKDSVGNGRIESTSTSGGSSAAIRVGTAGTDKDITVTIESGTMKGRDCGIFVAGINSKLVVNGGYIEGTNGFGVSGNGSMSNNNTTSECGPTTITINGGKIIGGGTGIYHPQVGQLMINNGEITGKTGVEIRAGGLIVSGGTITATGDSTSTDPNGNGSTTVGAAIAVVQHTTKQPINVKINGGSFNGVSALYEANPQSNPKEATEKIGIVVNGGTFNGAVNKAQDGSTLGVMGGTFNTNVSNYVCTSPTVKDENNKYYVGETAEAVLQSATSGTFTVVGAVEDEALNVKPGVTIVNNSNTTIKVNDKEVPNNVSYTVPGAPIIIYNPTVDTPKANDQKNPGTGANDFVGVAAAMAVVSLLGAAAVIRKK